MHREVEMFEEIVPGLVGESEVLVGEKMTARHLGSGDVSVFATPEMVRLMERAAVAAVDAQLPEGHATVGVGLDVRHLAATPVGMRVSARAELKAVAGRELTFEVTAWDETEPVGSGVHKRFVVDLERFRRRVGDKRKET